jgi:hypothetical protein
MNSHRFGHVCALLLIGTICASSQDTLFVYPSMADVIPTVAMSVVRNGQSSYEYAYLLGNGQQAAQDIWIFMIAVRSEIASSQSPQAWRASRAFRPSVSTVFWGSNTPSEFISPGQTLSGFVFHSLGLPSIRTFYAVGRVEPPEGDFEIAPGTNDIFANSAQGQTLGPADPPTPFHTLTFLDTIKSYITESRTLGWITTQATADKYTALINSAQVNLASSPPQRGVAKAKLDSVLTNVYPDSAAALLTSEAYALLRFNTEYVLKKLREEDEERRVIEGKEK